MKINSSIRERAKTYGILKNLGMYKEEAKYLAKKNSFTQEYIKLNFLIPLNPNKLNKYEKANKLEKIRKISKETNTIRQMYDLKIPENKIKEYVEKCFDYIGKFEGFYKDLRNTLNKGQEKKIKGDKLVQIIEKEIFNRPGIAAIFYAF